MKKALFLLAASSVFLTLEGVLPEGYDAIFIDPEASAKVSGAADELAALLHKAYGQVPEIHRGQPSENSLGLCIKPLAFVPEEPTDIIRIERTESGLTIGGQDDTATCFAVYRFLEEFLGWRLYQPGALGYERLDDPPEPPAIQGVPMVLREEKAAYYSRNLYNLGLDAKARAWRDWNGLRERFSYNHSLHRVITPDLFEVHPDWFARDSSGTPKRPPYRKSNGFNDHPDLSNPDMREYVSGQYVAALEGSQDDDGFQIVRTPGTVSVSLSLADSYKFGHFDEDYPWKATGYFRRWPNWSNHVFAYTNAVASRITEQFQPGDEKLYLGALAYLNWEREPSFPLHPSVVPYLTYDRSQWYSRQSRADDLANVSRWAQSGAPFIGTWDYLFSSGFLIPRSLSTIVRESIPALHERGVRAYFSQVGSIWPYDGHTSWLTTRLLWNPEADAGALLDEYFAEYYGPAAGTMRSFFETAERLWMQQSGTGWWLRYWQDPWQASLWDPDAVRELDTLLERALDESRRSRHGNSSGLSPDRFRSRIWQTASLFAMTRNFRQYQAASWDLQAIHWESAERAGLEEGVKEVRRLGHMREDLRKQLGEGFPGKQDWVFTYDPLDAIEATLSSLLSGSGATPRQLLHDPELEKIDDSRIWGRHFIDSEDLRTGSLPGGNGFFVENARRGHIFQLFRAEPGQAYLATADVLSDQSPSADIHVRMEFFDANRRLLGTSSRGRMAPADDRTHPRRLRAFGIAPEETVHARLLIRFYEMDMFSRAEVYGAGVTEVPNESGSGSIISQSP